MDIPTYGYGKSIGDAMRTIWDPRAEAEASNFRTSNEFNQVKLAEAKKAAAEADEDKRLLADLISGKELQGPVPAGQEPLGRTGGIFTPGKNGFAVGIDREAAGKSVHQIVSRLTQRNPAQAAQIMAAWNKATLDGGIDGDFFTALQASLVRSGESVHSVTNSDKIPLSPIQAGANDANDNRKLALDAAQAERAAELARIARENEAKRAAQGIPGPDGNPIFPKGSRIADWLSGTSSAAPLNFNGVMRPSVTTQGANVSPMTPATEPEVPTFMQPVKPAQPEPPYDPIGFPGEPAVATPPAEVPVAPIAQAEANGETPTDTSDESTSPIAGDLAGLTPIPGRPGLFTNSNGDVVARKVEAPLTANQKEQIRLAQERLALQERAAEQKARGVANDSAESILRNSEARTTGVRQSFSAGVLTGRNSEETLAATTEMHPSLKANLEMQWSKQFQIALAQNATKEQAYAYATAVMTDAVKRHYSSLRDAKNKDYIRDGTGEKFNTKEIILTDPSGIDPDVVHAAGTESMVRKQDVIPGSTVDDDVEKGIVFNTSSGPIKISQNDANRKMILAAGIIKANATNGYLRMPDKDGKPQQSVMVDWNMANEARNTFRELYNLIKASGGTVHPDVIADYNSIFPTPPTTR